MNEQVTARAGARSYLALPWVQAAGFALLALIPRVSYLLQERSWPFFTSPVLDAGTQVGWAKLMVDTPLWMGTNVMLAKAPLYTHFLAFHFWLFGASGDAPALLSAHVLQFLFGAITCGLIYLIGRQAFGAAAGAVAAVLFAFFAPQIFNEGELLDTALATLLSAAFLLALLATAARPTVGRWLGTGVLLGLLGLTRPNLLLLAPVTLVLLWRWVRREREPEEARAMLFAFAGGLALIILPITARNALLTHEFVPIANNGGINFYTGNRAGADGYSPIAAGVEWERSWYEWKSLGWLTASQQDRFYRGRALAFWRQQPGAALALLVKKGYLYWNAYDLPNNLSFQWAWANASVLRVLPFGSGIVGTLGLAGLALGLRRSREAKTLAVVVATIMASVVIVFVNGRYRAPMLPALLPFAGLAAVELGRAARARQTCLLAGGAVALVVCGLLVNTDLYGVRRSHAKGANRDFIYLGTAYQAKGETDRAREAFRRATRAHPEDADAWAYRGWICSQTGDLSEAEGAFRKALELAPDYARAAASLAELSMERKQPLAEPKRLLERALSTQTENAEARLALVQLDLRLQDPNAQRDLERLVETLAKHDPNARGYDRLLMGLSQVLMEAKQAGLAVPPEAARLLGQ